jgi:ATP-dependent DNA ligase
LLAQSDAQRLAYVGSAFIALSTNEREALKARLKKSKVERCPIPKLHFPDAEWVKPQLVAHVRHLSGARYLRHATVRGFAR